MNEMKIVVHVAVMDYSSGSIKLYTTLLKQDWKTEDVEKWLEANTGYKESQCYFMASRDSIAVERHLGDRTEYL